MVTFTDKLRPGRRRFYWLALLVLILVAILALGLFLGQQGRTTSGQAIIQGEMAGSASGERRGQISGREAGWAAGRQSAYQRSYQKAYRQAYQKAFTFREER